MSIQASDRFLKVLRGEPVDRTPAWLMRQAGRYLPEYRATRAKARDFIDLCQTPDLACEVTLQPLRRFPLDAAILFQDILTLPHAMGMDLTFIKGQGPQFHDPIRHEKDLARLHTPDIEKDMPFVGKAIELIVHELDGQLPLIGFSGSPWTVATYLCEGQPTKQFSHIRRMMYEAPHLLHALLDKMALATIDYLSAQVHHGVDCLMMFDTWGGILPYEAYQSFSLAYMKKIIAGLREDPSTAKTPIIVFTKQAAPWYADLASVGADAVGADWTMPLSQVRRQVGPHTVLQGNLDPFTLFADDHEIEKAVAQLLEDYGHGGGHIFNLGHGMLPELAPEKVGVMLDALHRLSPQYHQHRQRKKDSA